MILNLMPCVLPVLSLKVMGFVRDGQGNPHGAVRHGLAFAAGVVVFFWVLAGALLALRAGGEQIGWGFQLQSPVFVMLLSALFLLLSLNLFGVFELGASLTAVGNLPVASSGLASSFWSGALATIVATPCTAPFMARRSASRSASRRRSPSSSSRRWASAWRRPTWCSPRRRGC